jgi:hypothetical protein
MEFTTTAKEITQQIKNRHITPDTVLYVKTENFIKDKSLESPYITKTSQDDDLMNEIQNHEPIDIEGDIVQTLREERERLDTRNNRTV